jgi:hypothetical protein
LPVVDVDIPTTTPVPPIQYEPPPVMLNAAALALTVKDVVLDEDGLATQPVLFIILFIVNVVEPAVVSKLDGMVNVPFGWEAGR